MVFAIIFFLTISACSQRHYSYDYVDCQFTAPCIYQLCSYPTHCCFSKLFGYYSCMYYSSYAN